MFWIKQSFVCGDVSLKWSDRGGIIVKITLDMEESMKNVLRGSEPEALKRKVLQWVTSTIFSFGGGGTTRPLPRDGGAEELRGDPTVGPHPKVWTIDRE